MRKKDEVREHRIVYEIIVDAYDEYEQNMGWYYYFEENLTFPIKAQIKQRLRGNRFQNIEVAIEEITSEEDAPLELGAVEKNSDIVFEININDIVSVDTSDENLEILNDWLYWHNYPLLE